MTRYLISFNEGDMTFPDDDLPAVADAAHAVVKAIQEAGAWVFGGGLLEGDGNVVAIDGSVTSGPLAAGTRVSGFSVVDVATLDDALQWASRIAVSCRCAQEVREFGDDPLV